MQENVTITNRDLRKFIFEKKTVILDTYIKEYLRRVIFIAEPVLSLVLLP